MEYVNFGKTGVRVSRVGLGTMTFGKEADEAAAKAMVHRCLDAGVNHFDTADMYTEGRSEQLLGALLKNHRDQVLLATKAYYPTGKSENDQGSSRFHLVRAVEASLRRLQTDRIDVLYLHRFDAETDLEETLRAIEWLVQRGMILYPAVSNFAAWETMKALGIQRARGYAPIVALQPMFSLSRRTAEIELLPMARSEGLAVLPYSPLGGGLFSGKYSVKDRPEEGRLQQRPRYKARYRTDTEFEVAERFATLAKDWGYHPATLAIAWVCQNPGITAPLLGARSVEQLEPSLAGATVKLTDEQFSILSELTPSPPPATDRTEEQVISGRRTL